jgi:hypothetical protein
MVFGGIQAVWAEKGKDNRTYPPSSRAGAGVPVPARKGLYAGWRPPSGPRAGARDGHNAGGGGQPGPQCILGGIAP